ncbi:Hypothetical protein CINCED_3A003188 [Cinara cedri]|uniref:Uncharacterized protein n=1 Tax=Cinara cedri TaxID=506608 RepID=A0A5E4NC61_9HEMI|nr:Hypothetical protein CINCED_3A003188 [Cinara cedri]
MKKMRPCETLKVNQLILFLKDNEWFPGRVSMKANVPRSYFVEDGLGTTYRRIFKHLRLRYFGEEEYADKHKENRGNEITNMRWNKHLLEQKVKCGTNTIRTKVLWKKYFMVQNGSDSDYLLLVQCIHILRTTGTYYLAEHASNGIGN